jgi:hypothetical protein
VIARAVVRLLTTRGLLRIKVCKLCAAVVVAHCADQHEAAHRAVGQKR